MADTRPEQIAETNCPVCGYYCLGRGGRGCIDKKGAYERAVNSETGKICEHKQLARVCELCEKDAEIVALRAQLEQAKAERDNLVFRNDSLREQTTQLLIQRDNLVIAQDWLKATIARQREWIERAGHRPGCGALVCVAHQEPQGSLCGRDEDCWRHDPRENPWPHDFQPGDCDCGFAELAGG